VNHLLVNRLFFLNGCVEECRVEGKREGEVSNSRMINKRDQHPVAVTLRLLVRPLGPTNKYADKPREEWPEKC
jgi:hypothetical protein